MLKKITKFTKFAVISVIILGVILAVSISLLYTFYPEESVKQIIKSRAEILLNRKIDIGSLHYSPKGIVIYNFTIYDQTGDSNGTVLVKADEAVITFSLFSIIKKDFKLRTIYFRGLEVNCVFDKDGKSNIERLISEINEKTGSGGGDKNIQLSKIILDECRLRLTNPPDFVKPLEGEYRIDSTIHFNENKTFTVSDTKLTLPLKRGILYPELNIETSEKFIIRGNVRLENASLIWVYKFASKDPHLPFDVVNGQVHELEITKDYVKGSAKASSTLKNTKSIIYADGLCTVDINNYTVFLKDIKGKINSSSANVDSMLISTKGGGIRKFSFTNISFQLGDLRHILNSLPSALSGSARGYLSYDSSFFNGKIDLNNISYSNKTEIVSGLNTSLEIRNNIVKKENIPANVLGSSSTISIATTDNKFKNFYISVNIEKININNIQLNEGADSGDKFDIPVNISGKININELLYDDFVFKNTRVNVSATGSIIKINNIDTSILSGFISGLGSIDISGASPSVQTSLKFNSIKVHDIKFKNENLNHRLFGFAEGTANISLLIKENAAETIKGNATFTVTKGKVVNTGVQDGLIVFLSELRYKLKDLEFNKIYGNFNVAGNNININSFIFNSEDLRLSMSGSINKDLIAKDMKMKLEFDKYFIKDIPGGSLLLTLSEYASGKWYIIPFSLNGNITESKNMKMLKKNQ